MFRFHTILHPTDLSRRPDPAFALACDIAAEHGAQLIVLHVIDAPVAYGDMIVVEPAGHRVDLLRQLRELRGPQSIPVMHRLEEGVPAKVIVRVAEELHCDLIVMGTHGRHGLSRFLIGSVAEQVVRNAPCLVLTAKGSPPDRARAELAPEVVQR
jgi:universal stress protein A